ncbi:MAG: sensor histidine kinase [Acidimicrobiales bacterium]
MMIPADDLAVARCEIDAAGTVVALNKSFAAFLGVSRAEVLGASLERFLSRGGQLPLVRVLASSPPFGAQPLAFHNENGDEIELWVVARLLASGRCALEGVIAPPSMVGQARTDDATAHLRHVLVTVVDSLRHSSGREEVMAQFWAGAQSLLGSEQGYLLVADAGTLRPSSWCGVNSLVMAGISVAIGSHWAPAKVLDLGCPVAIPDARASDELDAAVVQALRVRTVLWVPLRLDEEAVLGFGWKDQVVSLGSHVEVAEVLGTVLALVLSYLAALDHSQFVFGALERAMQLREEFLSILQHELRTPLLTIRNAALRVQRTQGRDPREVNAMLTLMSEEASRLCRLADNSLDVHRMEDGSLPYELKSMNVTRLARAVASGVNAGEPRAPVVVCTTSVMMVRADRERVRQVLLNLVDNAERYSPSGSQITIDLREDGDDVVVRVVDKGPGISPEDVERVFEKFARGNGGSSGLGLYIARGIVAQHGGKIWCEPGPGGAFVFSLPRSK